MQIISESQSEFYQKIGSYLEQSAPNSQKLSIDEITKLLPLNLRELAWMIAICEGKYPYISIPWQTPALRDRVDVLHNIFLKQITDEISVYAATDAMSALSFDARTNVIHQLMGIEWEMTHDYNGKGIPTYYVFSINDTELLKSIFVRLLSAIKAKFITQSYEPVIMNIQNNNYNVDARTFNTEVLNTEQSNTLSPYPGNEINIIVVSVILPKLIPDKKSKPDINDLSWKVFMQLTDALNANGALVSHNIPKDKINKKHCRIFGVDSNGEQIDLTYEALKKRIESSLLQAYQQDTPPQKDTFKD